MNGVKVLVKDTAVLFRHVLFHLDLSPQCLPRILLFAIAGPQLHRTADGAVPFRVPLRRRCPVLHATVPCPVGSFNLTAFCLCTILPLFSLVTGSSADIPQSSIVSHTHRASAPSSFDLLIHSRQISRTGHGTPYLYECGGILRALMHRVLYWLERRTKKISLTARRDTMM